MPRKGASISFDEVLLIGEGESIQVGTPTLAGTAVTAKVVRQGKSRKVPVVKFKRRHNYLRQGNAPPVLYRSRNCLGGLGRAEV